MTWNSSDLSREVLEQFADVAHRGHERIGRVYRRTGVPGGTPFGEGEDNLNAILTPTLVKAICDYQAGHKYTAKVFGVSKWTVKAIRNGRLWAHAERPEQRQQTLWSDT